MDFDVFHRGLGRVVKRIQNRWKEVYVITDNHDLDE